MALIGIIVGIIVLIWVVSSYLENRWGKEEAEKQKAPDYRSDERLFMQVLRTRNSKRSGRGGVNGHYSGCIVCGVSISDDKRRVRPLCKGCDQQMQHDLHKEQREGKVPAYSDDTDDRQLIAATERRIIHCLMIAYDLDDHAITEECATADITAAKRFEKEEYQRVKRNRDIRLAQEQQQVQKQKADRKAAGETLKRLNK